MLRALFQTPDITPPPSEGAKTAVGCKEREKNARDDTPAHNVFAHETVLARIKPLLDDLAHGARGGSLQELMM